MRGEKINKVEGVDPMAGSPPRVRGKGAFWAIQSLSSRITPAYAGKSALGRIGLELCRDHPRVRGEKARQSRAVAWVMGSPPRTRGKAAPVTSCGAAPGITPAYAGKRRVVFGAALPEGDHPRVRGEKNVRCVPVLVVTGSPPRTRGKV